MYASITRARLGDDTSPNEFFGGMVGAHLEALPRLKEVGIAALVVQNEHIASTQLSHSVLKPLFSGD
jgi:hypothetical protein